MIKRFLAYLKSLLPWARVEAKKISDEIQYDFRHRNDPVAPKVANKI